jgi:single-strand DNA-binding protein
MLNKAILMGRITRDLELKYSQNNNAVCRFSVAIDRRYVKPGEERQTDFINVVSFGKTAEFVSKYFEKGRMINVIGSIQTGSYVNKDNQTVYTTDIIADEVNFCGDKKSGESPQFAGVAASTSSGFTPIDTDDDLPF